MDAGKLVQPKAIPKDVKIIKEDAPDMDAGMQGGVPGGVPGGSMGGVIGGVIGGMGGAPPPPKPTQTRIRQGGNVTAAMLINESSRCIRRSRARRASPALCACTPIIGKNGSVRATRSYLRASTAGTSRAGCGAAVEVSGRHF